MQHDTINMKRRLLWEFSRHPERYYQVELFKREGFVRKKCKKTGRYFWTLDVEREICPDQQHGPIGKPSTHGELDYVDSWREVEDFFVEEGHASVPRYPVVARWRPDLYFTVASIIDFQRVEGGKIVFEFPANPLIIPQPCLRFNDIENVGFSGRHYTEFVMIGQHALNDEGGYWKDRTIELDFRLLTERFGIPKEEITFMEDVWVGYGAFGYSLEYFVRGLELGNAVFTEFEGTPENYHTISPGVVDMGAGLERFVWISHGTPTSYDAVFGKEISEFRGKLGIDYDEGLSRRFFSISSNYDLSEMERPEDAVHRVLDEAGMDKSEYERNIKPLEDLYVVLDHSRALLFAMADGALPSNVGGGYNLRVIYRRALSIIDRNMWPLKIIDVMEALARNLKPIFPELLEMLPAVQEVLDVEYDRYRAAKLRARRIVEGLRRRKSAPTKDDLLLLYESHGVTPETLVDEGIIPRVPVDFYAALTTGHSGSGKGKKVEEAPGSVDIGGLPSTRKLYYDDRYLTRCTARVLRAFPEIRAVVLDRTIFYPRGGGQEPDRGTIDGIQVVDVEKMGDVVVHHLADETPREGTTVDCEIDEGRRGALMRHHTATHIINGAARSVLGPWVWQHSAFKDEGKARLDITHHSSLTHEQIEEIERLANHVVQRDIPVEIQLLPRGTAEKLYGFRLYQGGAVPDRTLRVVKIGDFDVEACGGTHCSSTGEVGLIKILRAERIQDGVVRMEFVAGPSAIRHIQEQARIIRDSSNLLGTQPENLPGKIRDLLARLDEENRDERRLSAITAELLSRMPRRVLADGTKIYLLMTEGLGKDSIIAIGDGIARRRGGSMFIGISRNQAEAKTYIVALASDEAIGLGHHAGKLVNELCRLFGGAGGGRERIGQGGIPGLVNDEDLERALEGILTS